MFSEYIEAGLERAVYKTVKDEDPIFVSVPELLAHGHRKDR